MQQSQTVRWQQDTMDVQAHMQTQNSQILKKSAYFSWTNEVCKAKFKLK